MSANTSGVRNGERSRNSISESVHGGSESASSGENMTAMQR